jgi:hypothetical protein
MKIKSDIRAGMTFAECDAQRNYWKAMVKSRRCDAPMPGPMPGPIPRPNPGGGWVGGRWYPDRSGACG